LALAEPGCADPEGDVEATAEVLEGNHVGELDELGVVELAADVANRASDTSAGVLLMPTAWSSTSFSTSLKRSLLR
jgi:hypothetical protein